MIVWEKLVIQKYVINTFKYHVFAPMGRFQLESIYLYFPPSSQLGTTVENKGKLILTKICKLIIIENLTKNKFLKKSMTLLSR